MFGSTDGRRIGEIWFEGNTTTDLPLLLKYIFTSERLSVQVHPDDAQARSRGLIRGKTECWYILDAEPGATLGLGLREAISTAELRRAALDGSLDQLMNWVPVAPGDFFYVPAGTIHAIGAGITLVEFQQNSDRTYRLFDYGRPRELHVDEAVAVSDLTPYVRDNSRPPDDLDAVLVNGPIFSLMRISCETDTLASVADRRRWLAPLEGSVRAEDDIATAGECLLVDADVDVELSASAVILCGAEGCV
jgi:mannose-6-phosphate isomerase